MSTFKYYDDFEYRLNVKKNTLNYDTKTYKLSDFLDIFKEHKKDFNLKVPFRHQSNVNSILNLILLKQGIPFTFIIKDDYSFMIGYYELKTLYRWMRKGYILRYNDMNYKYDNLSSSMKERLENVDVRVRIYDKDTNINDLIRIYLGSNIEIYRDPKGDNNLWKSEENSQN